MRVGRDTLVRSPFGARSTALEVVAGQDRRGEVILVTGGASGIGFETARALASTGAVIIIGVRDLDAGQRAAETIRAETPTARIDVGRLDLVDLAAVEAFAAAVAERWHKLDVLIMNAGISYTQQGWAENGWELRFATNHLGHMLLAERLAPQLAAAAPSRVVVVSSAAHKNGPINFDDIHFSRRPFEAFLAYAQSKTANMLFAVEYSRRNGDRGLLANALMPGSVLTPLQRYISRERMIQNGLLTADGSPSPKLKTPGQGAATSVWAAIGEELNGRGGLILEDCGEAAPAQPGEGDPWLGYAAFARDRALAERLWSECEAMLSSARG